MDVLGENEALQQFFDGQDVTEVVDTSMLEQYLSNEIEQSNFMLPESPPDSASEPCSPPQMHDVYAAGGGWSPECLHEEVIHPASVRMDAGSCRFKQQVHDMGQQILPNVAQTHPPYSQSQPQPHTQSQLRANSQPQARAHLHPHLHGPRPLPPHHEATARVPCLSPADVYSQGQTSPMGVGAELPQNHGYPRTNTSRCTPSSSMGLGPKPAELDPEYQLSQTSSSHPTGSGPMDGSKKRRRSESFEAAADNGHWGVWSKAPFLPGEGSANCELPMYDSDNATGGCGQGPYQLLSWERHLPDQWCTLYNSQYENLPPPGYLVDTDKGFNYSAADEAFVCQKKNHFQVTVHVRMVGEPMFVKTPKGPAPIDGFQVNLFGVKLEAHSSIITIEQSQSDRSKKPFLPVNVNLPGDKITKVTLGRLHFSETTANNMRKKGKPNPDQRYFLMVVALYATVKEDSHLVVAHVSERVIVRASNPGQFENDSDTHWQRGQAPDSVVCQGRVGINTESPDEALVVCGNAKIMGAVMHPSDRRAKKNIQEVDPTEQLRRIAQMRIVEYDYKPEFAQKMGIEHVHETGIIAQEVKEVLPNAVKEVGDVICKDGEKIPNFLMVDKEQIFMENVGAVKQLCKLTDNLETRIQELEVWNTRLSKTPPAKSPRHISQPSSTASHKGKKNKIHTVPPPPQKPSPSASVKSYFSEKYKSFCGHRAFQASVLTVIAMLAFCCISVTAIYLLNLTEDCDFGTDNVHPLDPDHPPLPAVDVCSLPMGCHQIQCCPSASSKGQSKSWTRNLCPVTPEPFWNTPSPAAAEEKPDDHRQIQMPRSLAEWNTAKLQSIIVMQSQMVIDERYCLKGTCAPGNYSYSIPISKFVPVNESITLRMNSTVRLMLHKCHAEETNICDSVVDSSEGTGHKNSTKGYVHKWTLPISQLKQSSYHFRAAFAGLADCHTNSHHKGILYTDYYLHFYRRCD